MHREYVSSILSHYESVTLFCLHARHLLTNTPLTTVSIQNILDILSYAIHVIHFTISVFVSVCDSSISWELIAPPSLAVSRGDFDVEDCIHLMCLIIGLNFHQFFILFQDSEASTLSHENVWEEPVERCMFCFKDFPLSVLVEHSEKCTGDMLGSAKRFKSFLPSIHDVSWNFTLVDPNAKLFSN